MTRPFWLLFTGTGRCGTGYMAQVMTSVGVKCSHEGVFMPDAEEETQHKVSLRVDPANEWWGWEGCSSWLAAPYLGRPEMRDVTIVHLVRHPKRVIDSQIRIRSFLDNGNKYTEWQYRHLPEMRSLPTQLERAAYFYVRWNRMIEPHAHIWHRIEDSTLALLDRLGVDWHDREVYANKRYNSRSGWGASDVDLDGLPEPLRTELRDMTRGYGYDWPA